MFNKQAAGFGCGVALIFTFYTSGAIAAVESDPWEEVNRVVYGMNKTADRAFLKPLAQSYHTVTPDIVETGIHNFFSNLGDVTSLVNNIFQLKPEGSVNDFSRVIFNSTLGIAGLIDVAAPMGIHSSDEDFGQTLGYWGVESGPYLVLPLFGPSSVRDGLGRIPDATTNVWSHAVGHIPTRNTGYGVNLLDTRVGLFPAEKLITGDEYSFVRDAYLQQRDYAIKDGKMDGQFNQDDF